LQRRSGSRGIPKTTVCCGLYPRDVERAETCTRSNADAAAVSESRGFYDRRQVPVACPTTE
jgi:hypothetical protein